MVTASGYLDSNSALDIYRSWHAGKVKLEREVDVYTFATRGSDGEQVLGHHLRGPALHEQRDHAKSNTNHGADTVMSLLCIW